MWTHAMKEKDEKVVTITDSDPATVRSMLKFMYKGERPAHSAEDSEIASLLQAAHKYQIPALVDMCVSILVTRLTASNAVQLLELADLVGLDSMKRKCLAFVTASSDTMATVQATESYRGLAKKRPHLLADIISTALPPSKAARIE